MKKITLLASLLMILAANSAFAQKASISRKGPTPPIGKEHNK